MNLWTIAGGAAQFLIGRNAAKETAKLMHTVRIALFVLMGFLGLFVVSLLLIDFFLILRIIEWFRS